jgi:hypothetical protein
VNGAASSGFRNKIINGCMRISKRGNGPAGLGQNYLGAEGIMTFIGGWSSVVGASISRESIYANDNRSTTGAIHYVNLGTVTGAGGYVIFRTRLKAIETCQLGNKYVTASCRLTPWTAAPTNHYFRIYKANALDDFAGVTLLSQSPNLGPIAVNQIVQPSHTFKIPSGDSLTGLHVELVCEYYSGSDASLACLFLGDFQFCEGTKAMPFELRPYAIEESLLNNNKGAAPPEPLGVSSYLATNAKYTYSNSITMTLPSNPENGDTVTIYNLGTVLTSVVGRNGKTIMGLAQDMTLDIANKKYVFEYLSATGDWRLGS